MICSRVHHSQVTSLEAYNSIHDLNFKQNEIFSLIKQYPGISNLDISRISGFPINCVTPRVKELRDFGLVVNCGTKKDYVTHRNAICWVVKE